jgi:hypothetical protein
MSETQQQKTTLPLLPTTVIGSYAYPSWLWTALEEMRQGKYGETDIAETLDDAVRMASTTMRFQDSASAYRLHRSVTNEAEAIAAAIWRYVADDVQLVRGQLRVLDAGTGDGRVLQGVLAKALATHRHRPCEVVLKEYDFQHIEVLLQNVAAMLRAFPRLTLFVTNRVFRELQGFPADVSRENTVCFDDVAGYRLLAMVGTASLLNQHDAPLHAFPRVEDVQRQPGSGALFLPQSDWWSVEQALLGPHGFDADGPALKALGDEIRAREIYDELAAAGGRGKHFTVTVARQENAPTALPPAPEFFWDVAIASHAFNRDREPAWICRNILSPLCRGLSVGGVLVNVHATDMGQMGELKRAIFGDAFPFRAPPPALAEALAAALDGERFRLLPGREFAYQARMTADVFAQLEPWERDLALYQLSISAAYHLQIPDEAWASQSEALGRKIQEILQRDGTLSYFLSIVGVKRQE